ncbi:MAG: D-aminoacyl-tRNA deacylase [Pseudomonadales bacterium]
MRALLQRVTQAAVQIDGKEYAAIGPGLLVLLGVAAGDDPDVAGRLARKTAGLRIFPDPTEPVSDSMNRSVADIGGSVLVVSQFTLAADTRKGMRPGFSTAAAPELALPLYEEYVARLSGLLGKEVATGQFGADMQVSLTNDGPVTFVLDQLPVG